MVDSLNNLIPIAKYAAMQKKNISTVRQKAQRGGFETAVKIGRDWFIDRDESYIDHRVKSGEYIKKEGE